MLKFSDEQLDVLSTVVSFLREHRRERLANKHNIIVYELVLTDRQYRKASAVLKRLGITLNLIEE